MMIYDDNGNFVWPNRVVRNSEWSVIWDTALPTSPAWLSTPAVNSVTTVTPISTAASRGTCRVTTAATVGSQATIQTASAIGSDSPFSLIRWDFESLALDSGSGYDFYLGLDGTATGAAMVQASGDAAAFGQFTLATPVKRQFNSYSVRNVARKNLAIMIMPNDGAYAIAQDDSIQFGPVQDWGSYAGGSIRPKLTITSQDGAAHWFEFSRVRLTLCHS